MLKVSVESVMDEAKRILGLRETTYANNDLEYLINQAATHLDTLSTYTVSCETLEVDCHQSALPEGTIEVYAMQPVTGGTCNGCCNINYDPTVDPPPAECFSCNCVNYYTPNRAVLTNFGQLGTSCGLFANAGFALTSDLSAIKYPTSFTPTEVRVWAKTYNRDSNGLQIINELQERGLAAYAAWKIAMSAPYYKLYSSEQRREWKTEWIAQKNWVRGKEAQQDAKQYQAEIAAIARAIVLYPGWWGQNYGMGFNAGLIA